jgi:hypothetical protein
VTAPVWPDPDPGWKVRAGGGLLRYQPLSESLAEAHRREDEREALQAARDAEMRSTAAAERLGELRMAGRVPRTPQELLADQARAEAVWMLLRLVVSGRRLSGGVDRRPGRGWPNLPR